MAAPDANVYIEIPAPDIRFAALLILALVGLLLWRRLGAGRNATFAAVAVLLVSAAIWLATTGNGRYFMAMLVAAGPITIALICLLPIPRRFKGLMAVLLVAGQAFVLSQQPPWSTWTVIHWGKEPYFAVSLTPEDQQGGPVTYASISLLTYSLVAPQFPQQTRWINLHAQGGTPRDAEWADSFLRRGAQEGQLRLFAPSVGAAAGPDGLPIPEMLQALDRLISDRQLRIAGRCRYLDSPGLARMVERERRSDPTSPVRVGFWTCPLAYVPGLAQAKRQEDPPPTVARSLARLSELCPRFFPPGDKHLRRLHDGWLRNYSSQTKAYVLDNGEVWYHFWRALNPVRIGKTADVIAGDVQIDCLGVRNDGAWRTGAR
jgi:hypothetical protein